MVREAGATGLARQGAPPDARANYTLCVIVPFAYGEVRYFRMARTLLGRAMYWTGVYLVDGLLVDSGPPNLARDVRRLVGELGVRQCVTTHHHEDHSGNHGLHRRVAWGARPPVSVGPLRTGGDFSKRNFVRAFLSRR